MEVIGRLKALFWRAPTGSDVEEGSKQLPTVADGGLRRHADSGCNMSKAHEPTFTFVHALLPTALYQSLLALPRAELFRSYLCYTPTRRVGDMSAHYCETHARHVYVGYHCTLSSWAIVDSNLTEVLHYNVVDNKGIRFKDGRCKLILT